MGRAHPTYYNDKWQVLTEIEDDEEDTVERDFVYGNYIDEVLMMVVDDTDTYYYAHDHLYSPVALMESDGDVVERYEYDAYGKTTIWNAALTSWAALAPYPFFFVSIRNTIF